METDVFTSYGRASFRTTALPTLRHGVIYKHLTFLRNPGHYQVGGEASEAHIGTYRVLCARLPALISVASPEGSSPGSALSSWLTQRKELPNPYQPVSPQRRAVSSVRV